MPPVRVFRGRAMASSLRLSVAGTDAATAARAWELVTAEFAATERELSRYREDSALSRLNAAGAVDTSPWRLRNALAAAHRAWRVTRGLFDPRVIGILEAWGDSGAPARRPSSRFRDGPRRHERRLEEPWLELGRRRPVRTSEPVDLGGIGKGLALRWAMRALARAAFRPGGLLLDAGGDVVVSGTPPDGTAWQIGVEDPDAPELPLAVVRVPAGGAAAIATSSRAVRAWRAPDGTPVHHLVDPRTERPGGRGLVSVTVVGDDPAWAEVWSKTLFLAGADGIAAAARGRGLAALWVPDHGPVAWSEALEARARPQAFARVGSPATRLPAGAARG